MVTTAWKLLSLVIQGKCLRGCATFQWSEYEVGYN